VQVDSFDLRYNYYAIICKQLLGEFPANRVSELAPANWVRGRS